MSMSGIEVDDSIPSLFNEMKLRNTHKFITFKIENKKKVIVDYMADPQKTTTKDADSACFDDLVKQLTTEPRYILYDFGFTADSGKKVNKLGFIFWCSDEAKIGDKMIYAGTKDTVKKAFPGIGGEFQANDMGDLVYETLSEAVEKKA